MQPRTQSRPQGKSEFDDDDVGSAFKHSSNNHWPEPKELHGELFPVAKLDPEIIPVPLRDFLQDSSHRMQCPLDFVATATICMLSGVIGAGCRIRPKERDDWSVVPNLWGGIVARPGMLKSPAINDTFTPLRRVEVDAKADYDKALNDHKIEYAAFEAQYKALKKSLDAAASKDGNLEMIKGRLANLKPPAPPLRRRFLTNNTTIEKASELLRDNPRGIIILYDELVGFLAMLERDDRKEDRSFHLEGWNGYGHYTCDRIGRGTIDTPQLCEVFFGGIQPSKLLVYLSQIKHNINNDGLLQRFQLLVYPDEPAFSSVIVDEYPDHAARDRVYKIVQALAYMDFVTFGAEFDEFKRFPYFRFSSEAQVFFNQWSLRVKLKATNREESPIMVEHLSKYPSLMPSLALIFHLVGLADKFGDLPILAQNEVSLDCAQKAARWCGYLETHARRIYALVGNTSMQSAKKILEKIKDGSLTDGFNARDIYRRAWGMLETKELVEAALEELVDAGWIREIPSEKHEREGRPSLPAYAIHPKAKK